MRVESIAKTAVLVQLKASLEFRMPAAIVKILDHPRITPFVRH